MFLYILIRVQYVTSISLPSIAYLVKSLIPLMPQPPQWLELPNRSYLSCHPTSLRPHERVKSFDPGVLDDYL